MHFLKETKLAEYIPFNDIYDPFLIWSAKNIKRYYDLGVIVQDENIKELFNVNVSYLYRLLRAQKKMEEYTNISRRIIEEDLVLRR
jgi:hypothetical protein